MKVAYCLILIFITISGVSASNMTAINVLQGTSILFEDDQGGVMLVDTGCNNDRALNYLTDHNITHINYLVISHAHLDHYGAAHSIIDAIPVDHFVYNGEMVDDQAFVDLINLVKSKNIDIIVPQVNDTLPIMISTTVLEPHNILSEDPNENGIVLKVCDKIECALVMGDKTTTEGNIKSNILIVSHHGSNSATSKSFLKRVCPQISIISVGPNDYGHPSSEVLQRLSNTTIHRTDLEGNITMRI